MAQRMFRYSFAPMAWYTHANMYVSGDDRISDCSEVSKNLECIYVAPYIHALQLFLTLTPLTNPAY
jgi:hypothetical protein